MHCSHVCVYVCLGVFVAVCVSNWVCHGVWQVVRGLVKSGQLQFINGGWSMHDEACTHYVSMIENTAFGHRFLKEEFDYVPTVGWQIDPFGHSATQVLCESTCMFLYTYKCEIRFR